MNKKIWKIICVAAILIVLVLFAFKYFAKGHSSLANIINVSIGQDVLLAEVANTPALRELGLGNRPNMESNHGMLFVFDQPGLYGFWMKDTLIPLDMLWIDQNKKIIYTKEDVLPSTFPNIFRPLSPALYVLEINAGYSKSHQIKIGDRIDF